MKLWVLGDRHTVSALGLAGAAGIVADRETVAARMRELLAQPGTAVIVITRELAGALPQELRRPAPDRTGLVIIEIPGIDDRQGFAEDELAGLAEVLGVPL